jgi:hypothetical protein
MSSISSTSTSVARTAPLLEPINRPAETFSSRTLPEVTLHSPVDISALSSKSPLLVAVVSALSYLAAGIVGFHYLLKLTWCSAFYFAVTTSMTVGYGDIDAWAAMSNGTAGNDGVPYTPSDGAIIFTMLYIIGGMIVMGTSLGLLVQSMLEGGASGGASQTPNIIARNPLIASAVLCALMMVIGAAFIVASGNEDILEGAAGCTGGHCNMVHGLYWAVVTMSTVGYGSGAPTTDGGRFFAGCFMLVGVSCMGNFVGELSARPLRAHRAKLEEKVINQYGDSLEESELWELASSPQFEQLGLRAESHGTSVTRNAFCLLMLVRTETLSADDLRRCQMAFDSLDLDGSGTLDMQDVLAAKLKAEAQQQQAAILSCGV